MAKINDVNRRRIEAEENAVLDVQFEILDILREAGTSKEELARRLGVTKARVSQLFAAGANPTVKQLARIYDALERALVIESRPLVQEPQQNRSASWHEDRKLSRTREPVDEVAYLDDFFAANENYAERKVAA